MSSALLIRLQIAAFFVALQISFSLKLFISPIYRLVSNFQDRTHDTVKADTSEPVKLDAAAQAHIEKHRKLQDNLTDEMVGLARQLKESSLVMSQSTLKK
ncbi:hypothetical protein QYF36_024051 [Acer negundo]|nr:hypothetical protein QYF36_024051 [Acer negundo]